jgi:uncharacterized protein (DUF433 family)
VRQNLLAFQKFNNFFPRVKNFYGQRNSRNAHRNGDDGIARLIYIGNAANLDSANNMQTWLSNQIALDPAICHGKPVVRGTRVLVANVVGAIAAGQSHQQILEDYPTLTEAGIRACLEFAGELTAMEAVEA